MLLMLVTSWSSTALVLSLLTGKNSGKRPESRNKQRLLGILTRGVSGQLERASSAQNRIDKTRVFFR